MVFTSFIAIGDSFTEGVGDDLPDGRQRGWADIVALGLAMASTEPVRSSPRNHVPPNSMTGADP